MSVQDINQNVIKAAIEPIWHSKSETARKALNRLNLVLEHASAKGLDVDLLAIKKARLLLGKPRHSVRRIPAMDWRDVPEFYSQLDSGSVTHLALRLLILTASRSTPIRFCRLEEIDGDVWTVPAEKMKSRKGHEADFRIPLSKAALETIEAARGHERDGFLFPSQRKGVISDATMAAYMTRSGFEERPHGFRTSFRTWCAEATDTPAEIAETALAHVTGNAVERAYRRTDFLERRRLLMEKWARYVCAPQGEVVPLLGGNVASINKS